MRPTERILFGVVIILLSAIVLWYGSPARTGAAEPIPATVWGFSILFAIGFIFTAMGLMGAENDYPALVSGLVLYFIIGALMAVFLYVRGDGIGAWTIYDADSPEFWASWVKMAATWPLELVRTSGLLGYDYYL